MIKRIIPIILVCAVMLCGCTANMGDGGAPTPVPDKETNWSETVSEPKVQIKVSDAEKLLAEIIPVMLDMSGGTLYLSDITYMSNVCDYLAQYNQFDTEIAVYMESVRQLLDSYCSLYAKNIGTEQVREQIDAYIDGYFGLTEDFRIKYGYIDNEELLVIMAKIEFMSNAASAA